MDITIFVYLSLQTTRSL